MKPEDAKGNLFWENDALTQRVSTGFGRITVGS